jgi:hypothetical protein
MVDIEQFGDVGFSNLKIESLSDIDPNGMGTFFSEPPDENCIFLEEGFSNFGNIDFHDENCFSVNLVTEIPFKLLGELHREQAWLIFNHHNVSLEGGFAKYKSYQYSGVSFQLLTFQLMKKANYGFIQFYSLPKTVRLDGKVYKQYSLMTISVFRNQKSRKYVHETITIRPTEKDSITVPLLPQQRLQLILPVKASIDYKYPIIFEQSSSFNVYRSSPVQVASFLVNNIVNKDCKITIQSKGKRPLQVKIPTMYASANGDIYPSFDSCDHNVKLLAYNISGLVVRGDDKNTEWIFDDFADVRVGKSGNVVATFSNSQKSIHLEKEQFWVLSSGKFHETSVV